MSKTIYKEVTNIRWNAGTTLLHPTSGNTGGSITDFLALLNNYYTKTQLITEGQSIVNFANVSEAYHNRLLGLEGGLSQSYESSGGAGEYYHLDYAYYQLLTDDVAGDKYLGTDSAGVKGWYDNVNVEIDGILIGDGSIEFIGNYGDVFSVKGSSSDDSEVNGGNLLLKAGDGGAGGTLYLSPGNGINIENTPGNIFLGSDTFIGGNVSFQIAGVENDIALSFFTKNNGQLTFGAGGLVSFSSGASMHFTSTTGSYFFNDYSDETGLLPLADSTATQVVMYNPINGQLFYGDGGGDTLWQADSVGVLSPIIDQGIEVGKIKIDGHSISYTENEWIETEGLTLNLGVGFNLYLDAYNKDIVIVETIGDQANIDLVFAPKGIGSLLLQGGNGGISVGGDSKIYLQSLDIIIGNGSSDVVLRPWINHETTGVGVTLKAGNVYDSSAGTDDLYGGNLYLYGGINEGSGLKGDVYLGTGSEGYLPLADSSVTNVVMYDPATGKLSYSPYVV